MRLSNVLGTPATNVGNGAILPFRGGGVVCNGSIAVVDDLSEIDRFSEKPPFLCFSQKQF
jgi:hypothetical protein